MPQFSPLRFQSPFSLFPASSRYKRSKDLKNRFAHLTNYSVNRKAEKFVRNENPDDDMVGSKWSLKALRRYLTENGYDVEEIWGRIEDAIIKTIISAEADVFSQTSQQVPGR